ncbi:MAG: flagellar basal body L-ring protein [Hyphomicrobiales bacterium]|nr:flagellar basal body L-ring protein FlgH [Hyphomicrobiales bacterium]PCJ90327.1 MAG: flagellar basal body L-ring protein [Hyphomicrobiales bacterium]
MIGNWKSFVTLFLLAGTLGACGAADKLAQIGQAPALSAIEDPTTQMGYRPVQMPMPTATLASYSPNSLWQDGRRAFFADQRAKKIGDLVTVLVSITDNATIANTTERSRNGTQNMGASGAVGNVMGNIFSKLVPGDVTPSGSIDLNGGSTSTGSGSVNRSEQLNTKVSAVVTQVLPNGNMVIEGKQEVRVNFEVRELIVAGVIRPVDISASNTIPSEKIAEARISYGGRGQITDMQQPRYGQQVMDIILPF